MTGPRLLITGSRYATRKHLPIIEFAMGLEIQSTHLPNNDWTLVHGSCHLGGADMIAETIWKLWGLDKIEAHPAQNHPTQDFGSWPGAGPRRNAYMVSLGATRCLAFPLQGEHNKGTLGCMALAKAADIPVTEIWLDRGW